MTENEIMKKYFQLSMESATKLVKDKFYKLYRQTGNKLYLAIANNENTIGADDYIQAILMESFFKPSTIKIISDEEITTEYDNKAFYTLIGTLRAQNEYHRTQKKSKKAKEEEKQNRNNLAKNIITVTKENGYQAQYYVYNDFISLYDLGNETAENGTLLDRQSYKDYDYISDTLSLLFWELRKYKFTDRQLYIIQSCLFGLTNIEIAKALEKHEKSTKPYTEHLIRYNLKVIKKALHEKLKQEPRHRTDRIENSLQGLGKHIYGTYESHIEHLFKLLDMELGVIQNKEIINYTDITKKHCVASAQEWKSKHKWTKVKQVKISTSKKSDFKGYYKPQKALNDYLKEKKSITKAFQKPIRAHKCYQSQDAKTDSYTKHLFYLLDMELGGKEPRITKVDIKKYNYQLIAPNKINRTKSYEEMIYSWSLREEQKELGEIYDYYDEEFETLETETNQDQELDSYMKYYEEEQAIKNNLDKAYKRKAEYMERN